MKANNFDDLLNIVKELKEKLDFLGQALEFAKRPHRVKLSLQQAEEIRAMYKAGWRKEALAARFKVGVSCIKNVIYGVNWNKKKSVED